MSMPKQKPHKSKQNYSTPECFLAPTRTLLGIQSFAFDFACEPSTCKGRAGWTKQDNSLGMLRLDWRLAVDDDGWGWLNPEFTWIADWVERCWMLKQDGGQVALLVPASVGSNWYRDFVHDKAFVLVLNGRIPFIEEKPTWGYPKDCMLCLFSNEWEVGNTVWSWRD